MIKAQIIIDWTDHRKGDFIVRTSDTETGRIGERYFLERKLAEQALEVINSQLIKVGKKQEPKPVKSSKTEPLTARNILISILKVAAIITACFIFVVAWMAFGVVPASIGAGFAIHLLVTWNESGTEALKTIFQWLAAIAILYFFMSVFDKQTLERIYIDGLWIIAITVILQILISNSCRCSSKEK